MTESGLHRQARASGTVLAGAVSEPVIIPHPFPVGGLTVGIEPTAGGTGKCQYTLAARSEVEADPSAVTWRDWPKGDVSADDDDWISGPVTAVRFAATTTAADWVVMA